MKIKENVIEYLSALLLGSLGFLLITVCFYILSLIFSNKSQHFPYKVFIVEFIIIILSLMIYSLIYILSNNIIEIDKDSIAFRESKNIVKVVKSNIISINYIKCPWYLIPLMYFYKYGNSGIVTVKYKDGNFNKERSFRTFYKNIIKISNILEMDINYSDR